MYIKGILWAKQIIYCYAKEKGYLASLAMFKTKKQSKHTHTQI